MVPQSIKPSRAYYLLALLVLIVGVTAFVIFLIKGIGGITDKLVQMEAPGTAEMNFAEPGTYTIFYEPESVFEGKVYNTRGNFSGVWCTVVSKETNSPVRLDQSSMNTTYTVGNRSGMSLLDFEIDRPGIYEVSAAYRDNPDRPKIVLAIGHGVSKSIATTVIVGIAIMFGTVILALLIGILTLVKRRRAKKAFMPGGPPAYPPPYPGR
ncbi:MAG: hypothetical protein QOJ64_1184 [Acidobacteriota bacterium]|jgi:hypothetical protein|nr:hypothetical protein [Acidobacteriota bacterium]